MPGAALHPLSEALQAGARCSGAGHTAVARQAAWPGLGAEPRPRSREAFPPRTTLLRPPRQRVRALTAGAPGTWPQTRRLGRDLGRRFCRQLLRRTARWLTPTERCPARLSGPSLAKRLLPAEPPGRALQSDGTLWAPWNREAAPGRACTFGGTGCGLTRRWRPRATRLWRPSKRGAQLPALPAARRAAWRASLSAAAWSAGGARRIVCPGHALGRAAPACRLSCRRWEEAARGREPPSPGLTGR
mmetsp:Transcript_14684/g.55326  ORF Transcript_14684/g.55326 Transcript_14684/m.55326 type:complete len:245 (-) Transcript_14684:112-846(-)